MVILLGDIYVPGAAGIDGVVLTQQSLVFHVGEWSKYFLTGAILLFAFSSIIYCYYLGETALAVFTNAAIVRHIFKWAIMLLVFIGASAPAATSVFFFSDPMMGILAIVNLVVLVMLFPTAMRVLNDFRAQLKQGIERPVFKPENFKDLDIDKSAWNIKD